MPTATVNFIMNKYKTDEKTAQTILSFYKNFKDQEFATVPGQLTPEESLLLQQQQQTTGPITTVRVPQTFGAGGAERPPPQTPEETERKKSWWESVWPWGYMQVHNAITDPLFLFFMGSGAAGYTGIRGVLAGSTGLTSRAYLPTLRPYINLGGVPSSQLSAAKNNPYFAEELAKWYAGGRRPRTMPSLTPEQMREYNLTVTPQGKNLLQRVTGPTLRFPQSAVSKLTEKEIMAAERDPAFAAQLRNWFNRGATGPKPVMRTTTQTQQQAPWFWNQVGYGRTAPTKTTPAGLAAQRGPWPTTTGARTPGATNIPTRQYPWVRNPLSQNKWGGSYRGPYQGTTPITQAQQQAPRFWSRAGQTITPRPGFWSRVGSATRGAYQSIKTLPSRLTPGTIGIGGATGLGIYGLGASTVIGAAIPAAGIIASRAAGEVLAPEWNAELSRQNRNEWFRPWFPVITRAPQSQEEWNLQLAAIPYWQGWNQAWNQLTGVLKNIGSTQQPYTPPGQ